MARAWAAAQHDTAFVTLSLSKGEAGSNSGYPRHPEPVEG
jgi:hypothetical protein